MNKDNTPLLIRLCNIIRDNEQLLADVGGCVLFAVMVWLLLAY